MPMHQATLIAGITYSVFGKEFKLDVPHPDPLTDEQRAYLEGSALRHQKTTDGHRITTCLFVFDTLPDALPEPEAPPVDVAPSAPPPAPPAPPPAPPAPPPEAPPAPAPDAPPADAPPADDAAAKPARSRG